MNLATPQWRKVGAAEYTWTGVMMTALVVDAFAIEPSKPNLHWSEPILFDKSVRDAFVLGSDDARKNIGTASWVLFVTAMAYPYVVDVPVALSRSGGSLAWQLFWQNTLVLTTTAVIELGLREITSRSAARWRRSPARNISRRTSTAARGME
ncbi:MAG: hypothetical protein ACXWUG_23255 [Polyangiales bacterium]